MVEQLGAQHAGPLSSGGPVRVCIFPSGSEIALEVHRALAASPHVAMLGAASRTSNHGPYVFRDYVAGLPHVTEPDFLPAFNRVLEEYAIDLVYPAHDDALVVLTRETGKLAADVVASSAETCAVCRSKRATYERLAAHVPTPAIYNPDEAALPFPVFLKPDASQGSKGVHIVYSRDELVFFCDRTSGLLALEYLPGAEYTVDCFSDRHGRLRFVGPRERVRTVNGISTSTHTVDPAPFIPMAEAIHAALPFRGGWFFQVKARADGELVLMEAAPRVSGGMALYRVLGVNFALLSVYDRLGLDVEIRPIQARAELDRALMNRFHLDITYRHVYIDLDDTVLSRDGGVNPFALLFLHQCRRMGVPVYLLTRHTGAPQTALQRLGLESLFAAVHHVTDGACKSGFVTERDAIFIDDSFAERTRVHAATGVPCFAVDAIEALLDWRT